jgi:hypothetical protein
VVTRSNADASNNLAPRALASVFGCSSVPFASEKSSDGSSATRRPDACGPAYSVDTAIHVCRSEDDVVDCAKMQNDPDLARFISDKNRRGRE